MTMGVRIGGLLLLCYLGLVLALDAAWRAFAAQRIAVLLGTAFAGERFGSASLLGSGMVLGAVVLVGLARTRRLRPVAVHDAQSEQRKAA